MISTHLPGGVADVPADPGRGRRPARHHDHRGVLHQRPATLLPLALALVPLGVFAVLVQRRVRSWWLLLPLAVAAWVLVHESGVHATVAGVLLGFTVPVIRRAQAPGPGLAEHFEHRFRPLSAGVAVPVFAFFAAGVSIAGTGGRGVSLTDPVTLGVVVGLVVGKTAGVLGSTWLVQRFTRAQLAEGLSWWDVLGLALLSGIGFTVSLLIGELAFGAGSDRTRTSRSASCSARCCPHCSPASSCGSATATTGRSAHRKNATRRRWCSGRLRERHTAHLTRQHEVRHQIGVARSRPPPAPPSANGRWPCSPCCSSAPPRCWSRCGAPAYPDASATPPPGSSPTDPLRRTSKQRPTTARKATRRDGRCSSRTTRLRRWTCDRYDVADGFRRGSATARSRRDCLTKRPDR